MRIVSIFTCSCFAHYKAVTEIETRHTEERSVFTCPECGTAVLLEGKIQAVDAVVETGLWRLESHG
jgi:hypothetical protein